MKNGFDTCEFWFRPVTSDHYSLLVSECNQLTGQLLASFPFFYLHCSHNGTASPISLSLLLFSCQFGGRQFALKICLATFLPLLFKEKHIKYGFFVVTYQFQSQLLWKTLIFMEIMSCFGHRASRLCWGTFFLAALTKWLLICGSNLSCLCQIKRSNILTTSCFFFKS